MDMPINPDEELPQGEAPELLDDEDASSPLEKERDEYRDGWQRAKADLVNYKRQETDRVNAAIGHGLRSMAEDLLLILDSFGLALSALEPGSPGEQGTRMIRSQLLETLRRYGVEQIPPADLIGKEFDPAVAEAIGTMPSPGQEDGTVAAVAQDGYRMNGRTLRPARVRLASNEKQ